MKLDNKGITTIEVLICFVLVVIITVSMYVTISSFNNKKTLESYKEEIYSYKNTLTKEIQDDFIKVGLTHVNYDKRVENETEIHTLTCNFKDGTTKQLVIEQRLAYSTYHTSGSVSQDDYFMIKYGPLDDMIEYPLPELGTTKNEYGKTIQDLEINSVLISIDDENVLSVYIGLYYPDFDTRYAINIVCPIDYISTGYDSASTWNY